MRFISFYFKVYVCKNTFSISGHKNMCNSCAHADQALKFDVLIHQSYCSHSQHAYQCAVLYLSPTGTILEFFSCTLYVTRWLCNSWAIGKQLLFGNKPHVYGLVHFNLARKDMNACSSMLHTLMHTHTQTEHTQQILQPCGPISPHSLFHHRLRGAQPLMLRNHVFVFIRYVQKSL